MSVRDTRVGRLILGTAEFLPLLAFVYAGRLESGLADRFYWGAGAAVAIVPVLVALSWRLNPLLIAVNLWLCLEALIFLVQVPALTAGRRALAESAFFVAMIVVGAGYLALSQRGLFTVAHDDRRQVRVYSGILLALVAGGLVCSIVFRGDEMFSAFVPAAAIFVAQALLTASLREPAEDQTVQPLSDIACGRSPQRRTGSLVGSEGAFCAGRGRGPCREGASR